MSFKNLSHIFYVCIYLTLFSCIFYHSTLVHFYFSRVSSHLQYPSLRAFSTFFSISHFLFCHIVTCTLSIRAYSSFLINQSNIFGMDNSQWTRSSTRNQHIGESENRYYIWTCWNSRVIIVYISKRKYTPPNFRLIVTQNVTLNN